MTNGRRAADRRRERGGGGDFYDDELGTTPGAAPASPHNDYVEVDDEPSQVGLPLTSREEDLPSLLDQNEVVARDDGPSLRAASPSLTPRQSQAPRGQIIDEELPDAEKSFAREFKRRPAPTDTRVNVEFEVTEVKELKARKPRLGGTFRLLYVGGEAVTTTTSMPVAIYPSLLGRSADADLKLEDPTVSLRHAEINYDDDGGCFNIVDLGSRSGTLKNGIVIGGRTALDHGDVISLGKTELRFLRADAVPTRKPEPELELEPAPAVIVVADNSLQQPERTQTNVRIAREHQQQLDRAVVDKRRAAVRHRALLVIGGCFLIFGAIATVTLVYRSAFSDSAPAQIRHQVAVLLGEAKKQLQEGDVDAAHARVITVLGLDPENAEGISLDRTVTTEKSSRDALQLALRMGDEDRDDEALAALARIADSSVFARDRNRLKTSLASRALVRSLRAVENLLDQGRVDDALALAEAHVKRFPDDLGGLALLARVQAAKAGVSTANPGLGAARQAFAEGRLDDARRIAVNAGYAGYAADVDHFERSLNDGTASLTRFDGAAARGPMDEAFRLLGSLGATSTSPMFLAMQKPYADALYLSGTEKLEAGDQCGAARELFNAVRVLPGDTRLAVEMQKLQAIADQGLQKARGARAQDGDRAAAIAREALCVARSGSETFEALQALTR